MPSEKEPMPKRRKLRSTAKAITLGKKTISLEGYLAPPLRENFSRPNSPQLTIDQQRSARTVVEQVKPNAISPAEKSSPARKQIQHETTDNETILKARKDLPIWNYRDQIRKALRSPDNNVLILAGETGSGKSTQVPQFLYQEQWCQRRRVKVPDRSEQFFVGGSIAITQPRRVAATTLAQRVSEELGTPLGNGCHGGLVGYSVRFDHNVPKGAKIKFLTEGTLLQELLRDPYLRQYSAVVVDEVHERSLDADLLLGFLKQTLDAGKTMRGNMPLKIIIMSATANIRAIKSFFGPRAEDTSSDSVQVLLIEGRQFPVQVSYESEPVADLQDTVVKKILRIHSEEPLPGDILAFLTGQEEIEVTKKLIEEQAAALASNLPCIKVLPLYGQLSLEGQRDAFMPVSDAFTRKIVLATNIAETSVTVPGVRYVVDCGKAKIKQYRPRLGMESLLSMPISKSSAIQRTGRAGREAPGKCFRLYTKESFDALQSTDLPEILRNDVLGAVLAMKACGIQDIMAFPLMDMPEIEAIEKALVQLHYLGALNDDGCITAAGEKMARLPIPASLGAVLLAAGKSDCDCLLEVIDIISCITCGEDIFLPVQSEEGHEELEESRKELQRREGDLLTYLTTIQLYNAERSHHAQWCKRKKVNMRNMKQALNIRKQIRGICLKEKLLDAIPNPDLQSFHPPSPEKAEAILRCFLRGYAYKTAILMPDGSYTTIHGKHIVTIHPASVLHRQKKEAIMFLDHVFTNKSYAKKVSAIRASWIAEALDVK